MKKTGLILGVLAVLLQACSDKDQLPKDVLPPARMQAVMWDMIRGADFLNNYVFYRQPNVDKTAESEKWNNKIFQIHKITRQQFDASYAYYQQHPQMMKAIMDSIAKIKVEQPLEKLPGDTAAALAIDTARKAIDTGIFKTKIRRMRKLGGIRPALNN